MSARKDHEQDIQNRVDFKISNYSQYEYLKEFITSMYNAQMTTKLQYLTHVIEFLKFLEESKDYKLNNRIELQQIVQADIYLWQETLISRSASDSTISAKLNAVQKFFGCMKVYLSLNPFENIKVPYVENDTITTLEDDEFKLLVSNIRDGIGSTKAKKFQMRTMNRDLAIVYLLINTGIRIEALTEINLDDINLKDEVLSYTDKGGKKFVKVLRNSAVIHLNEYMNERLQVDSKTDDDKNALFLSNNRTRISTRAVQTMIHKYSLGVDKHVTPHVFRKTFGTNLYNMTGDIFLVAEELGHSDNKTTQKHYVKIKLERKREIAKKYNIINE
jgi:site-specific recombinase XerD